MCTFVSDRIIEKIARSAEEYFPYSIAICWKITIWSDSFRRAQDASTKIIIKNCIHIPTLRSIQYCLFPLLCVLNKWHARGKATIYHWMCTNNRNINYTRACDDIGINNDGKKLRKLSIVMWHIKDKTLDFSL